MRIEDPEYRIIDHALQMIIEISASGRKKFAHGLTRVLGNLVQDRAYGGTRLTHYARSGYSLREYGIRYLNFKESDFDVDREGGTT